MLPDAYALLKDYQARGPACFDQLNIGAQVLLHDANRKRSFLAVDPMGIEKLVYRVTEEGVYFADKVLDLADDKRKVSRQQIFDYLFFHTIPAPNSILPDVKKISQAQVLVVHAGWVATESYWRPTFDESFTDTKAAAEELRSLLANAVGRFAEQRHVGAFLSGGLDSSTVSGLLSSFTTSAATFSIGFDAEGYDELEYARIANKHFGCSGHELVAQPKHIVENFSAIATAFDEPFGNSSVIPTLLCAQFARAHGIDTLLAGDGGDELFAGNERYGKQKLFEVFRLLPTPLRQHVIQPLVRMIPKDFPVKPLRKVRSYVEQAAIPLPRRFETWNFAYREGIDHMLHADFVKSIDTESPMRLMTEVFDSVPNAGSIDRMLAYDWKFTLADNDLRKVNTMCDLGGVSVCFPMLDKALVDFSAKLPGQVKLQGQNLRAFFKQAMTGFLPQEILNKPKHGFGLPFGVWLKQDQPLADLINSRLDQIKRRDIFQQGFIDQLIQDQQDEHAQYLGYFIWDLAMLEEWLTTHQFST